MLKDQEKDKIEGKKENDESLKIYIKHLEERLKRLETDKQLLDAERLRLQQEYISYNDELDRLKEPPLVGAIIVGDIDKEKKECVIKASTGPFFKVKISNNLKGENLSPCTFVGVNQRYFTVMEVLNIDLDDYKKVNRLLSLCGYT